MELTMEDRKQFAEFFEESKSYRKTFEDGMKEIKFQVSAIQLTLAEEKGKDIPARLLRIENELDSMRSFRDSVTGSINSLKWVLGIGFGFISSLLVGLIILIARELLLK